MHLRAVFFDLDDTLVLTHKAMKIAHDAVKLVLGERVPLLNANVIVDTFISGFNSKPWDPLNKINVTEWRSLIWDQALETQGLKDIDLARELQDCFEKERLLAFQWAAGVEKLVRDLKTKGLKIGLITNGHKEVQRAKIKACNADDLFDVIIVGGEEPQEKPHKEIFQKACELAGCHPQNSIMVGDNLKTDILGGIYAGFLATVWVNLHGLETPTGPLAPSFTISTIAELPKVLQEIENRKASKEYGSISTCFEKHG